MKIPFVKEWGSWAVFVTSWLAALIAGLLTRPWETGREFVFLTILSIVGLAFLINSKNPLAAVIRSKGKKKEHIGWFLFFSIVGLLMLVPFLIKGIGEFWPFSLLIVSYSILLSNGKEHHILAELNGFAMLTLSAPIIYFAVTGDLSLKLYAAVTIFFAAGVFKVRVRIKKSLFYRWVMALYCAAACLVFYLLNIALIILLPLAENIVTAIWMREEKLKTTGYTELVKGIVFIILIGFFW
jgi:hypothetical protein